MRYINMMGFSPSDEWLQDAARATLALQNASDADARRKILEDNAHLWTEQKLELSKLSHGKCWYCESRQVRSDNAVDHFRPKGRVRGVKHSGYWWLAFKFENYRYTCTLCNSIRNSETTSGGKQDFFPLRDEEKRAQKELDDLQDEDPVLLDPTTLGDMDLLAFSEDGSVAPSSDKETEPFNYERAANSIERYHLRHPKLVERRIVLLTEIKTWIEQADKDMNRYDRTREVVARDSAENRMKDIRKRLLEDWEYSAAARYLLFGMTGSSRAARKVLRGL